MRYSTSLLFALLLAIAPASCPAATSAPWQEIGSAEFGGWSGVTGEAVFRYPEGPKGWYSIGFARRNDSSADWHDYYGLQFEVLAPERRTVDIHVTLRTPPPDFAKRELLAETSAGAVVDGGGWKLVTLPWSAFDLNEGQKALLWFVREVRLAGEFADGKSGEIQLRNVRLTRAPGISLDTPLRGKAAQAGKTVSYEVTVGNCTNLPQQVGLSFEKKGWEVMEAAVEPARLNLAPGGTAHCTVSVTVPERVGAGGHERQKLIATGQGGAAPPGVLELVTARDVPRPFILHTAKGWDDVREKVKRYGWAKKSQDEEYVKAAEGWKVPEVWKPGKAMPEGGHPYVFASDEFQTMKAVAVAWQLTRNKAYAEKVALALRRMADEKTGYPSTRAAVNQGEPQEGENFQNIAMAYDMILDAGVLSEADRAAIEHTFRLYMDDMVEVELNLGNVGNWNTAMGTGALFCALAMGDLAAAERYIYGPTGFTDYLSKGIMDDGWWWECSTAYNLWVSAELTQSALACRPWGIDLLHLDVPSNYSPNTVIAPFALPPYLFGIHFEKWGPNHRNTRSVKMLWDALPVTADYRGILFGMSDGHEEQLGGPRIELAYFAYRDPVYASIIKLLPKRDLIYGVPELPPETPPLGATSAFAENIGFSLLRSQTPDRPPREQIEAALKFGSHGGYHGHFDRTALNTLMRYGRSFYNPESIWHGYASTLYKFYVQTSINHNMVVVDGKMQEAVPSSQLLFHSGPIMQAAAVETNARWSDPPYGGMVYKGGETLAERQWDNAESYPIVSDRKWGELGPYGDRVLQRRLMVTTGDYVVLADYLKGEKSHTFDNIFQMKGFGGLEAPEKKFMRYDAQFDSNPHSSGQFITDVNWYEASAPAAGKFEFKFGPGADNEGTRSDYNEEGVLKMDVHSLWPKRQQIGIGMPPETHGENQRVTYTLTGDGKTLAHGRSGVWILGQVDFDVPVEGVKELALHLTADGGKKKALFLANARLLTGSGRETPVTSASTAENIEAAPTPGQDYYGGPIKISGVPV